MNRIHYFVYLSAFFVIYSLVASFSLYKIHVIDYIVFLTIFTLFIHINSKKRIVLYTREGFYFLGGWGVVYLISAVTHGEFIGFGYLSFIIFSSVFLSLKFEYQRMIVTAFVWGLSFLLFLSIIEYIFLMVFNQGFLLGNVTRSTILRETYFSHYLFNIVRIDNLIVRFQFLANEPGLIGTLCGMLLFLTWRIEKARIPFYIFMVAGLISFSLAFYVLLALFFIANGKMSISKVVVLLFFAFGTLYLVQEKFNNLILERVMDNDDIDNRTSDTFEMYFDNSIRTGGIIFGEGTKKYKNVAESSEGGNAGAKVWIFTYGIISFIIIFMIYNVVYWRKCNKRLHYYDWIFLLAFWFSFYQRQTIYTPYTMIVLFSVPLFGNSMNKASTMLGKNRRTA